MQRSYKFRLYPSKAQEKEMCRHLWISKELWNLLLGETIKSLYYPQNEIGFSLNKKLKVTPFGEKTLWERQHNCPSCGLSIDRDVNAAINILTRATVGITGSNACEDEAIVSSMKQEAITSA